MSTTTFPLAEFVIEYPKSLLDYALFACFGVAFLLVILLYIRDTRRLHPIWTFWLLTLRLLAFAALVIIAFNPRDRTINTKTVLSKIILLVDTSSSMDLREKGGGGAGNATAGSKRSRAAAVRDMLQNTPVLDVLAEYHNVSIYTFDKELYKQPLLQIGPESSPKRIERQAMVAALKKRFDCRADGKPAADVSGVQSELTPWQRVCRTEGTETRLGAALNDLMRLRKAEELSAIVVISDGGQNSGLDPKAATLYAKENKIKLYTIGVGSTDPPVNLRLAGITAPTEVNRSDPYDLTVFIQGTRLPGKIVEVDLKYKKLGEPDDTLQDVELVNDKGPESRLVVLPKDGSTLPKTFEIKPLPPGNYEYHVKLRPAAAIDEFDKDDNAEVHQLSVIERNLGVLLIAGGPMRDYRFVRNMLFRHKNIDVDVWLQTVDERFLNNTSQDADDVLTQFPETFPVRPIAKEKGYQDDPESRNAVKYDAIVAFDPDWKSDKFGAEGLKRLERWLSERAGGVIVVAGDVNTRSIAAAGDADEIAMVRDFYPVVLSEELALDSNSKSDTARNLLFGDAARGVDFLKLIESDEEGDAPEPGPEAGDKFYPRPWEQFYRAENTNTPGRGFYRVYPTKGTKAGAVVYARFDDPALSVKPVLLAAQDYGVGRVLYIGTPEVWRLRDLNVDYYDRFWIKAIREVLKRRLNANSGFGSIALRKDTYFVGDTVRVEANLLTINNDPVNVNKVSMIVIRPNGKALPNAITLNRNALRKGYYQGNFTVRERGTYRLQIANPGLESRKPILGKVRVKYSPKEKQNPIQDAALLTRIATETGGKYLGLDQFAGYFNDLKKKQDALSKLKDDNAPASDIEAAEEEVKASSEVLTRMFEDKGRTLVINTNFEQLWDNALMLYIIVALLSVEWLTRKLLKLA